jgi:hypothetical protein
MHNLAVAHIRSGQIARARYWIRQALASSRTTSPSAASARCCSRTRAGGGVRHRVARHLAPERFVASLVRRPARRRTA